ncbi:LysM peptidoglycan-binding domain-containing protein [Anaerobacillus alkaliphilus]|uniref:LysM peptidoglycan-binding domain-containing protein n=1 Tax=Anaerobacillus alkaliphilus TaxID=1548597 RepID=A0A4V1LGF0_9BACI|nr:glycosyl hydrolase family 18 protein [Anaerobacillus alkaliphilus]RXJ00711.1 LysM peptidoglycan-binding domain-containing protein [Anaerobacillus alkaliphilus]
MKQKLLTAFLVTLLFLLPITIEVEAKGPGNSSQNSKHNRTVEPIVSPIVEPTVEEPVVTPIPENNDPIEEEPKQSLFTYIVQSGDTLWKLSMTFGTTVEEIKTINKLTSDMIFVGQVLLIPGVTEQPAEQPVIQSDFLILGYYTKYWSTDLNSYRSLESYHTHLNSIAVTTFQVDNKGNIESMAAPEALKLAKEKSVRTYATIQNHFQPALTHTILSSSELRKTTITNIYAVVLENDFHGVNIDFENMYATDRQLFNQFIKEVSEFFKPKGYDVIVSVTAKTADNPTWAWSGTFDYAFLGQHAKLQLMTYDNSGTWSAPGATSGVDWVENVLKYATALVPSENLLIGLPAYGYEWYSATGQGIRALSMRQIETILSQTKATVHFDEKTQTPFFSYRDDQGTERVVWFEDERSISAKMKLVSKYNLGGVSMWRMGQETDQFWQAVTTHLK